MIIMASFNKLKVAGGLLIFALLCYLPVTDGGKVSKETRGMKLGSRPPRCEGKCLNCRPCIATLIAPIHQGKLVVSASKEDDTYYLLAWRCKCANKFFQP
ncbi:EPIDERMAL PATTERNING FACTOR-like protein 6 [Lycium ferocissimum]|uniref:EPIDERMAL PATTERNING FACTOR-like protein 6 n=1 Tax=Lycium ferocissimum TaxID=112874 RepID=UPI002815821A|nr:EPIDERMAL PATTERNING FACTOR-like protein 6 [Lycium ferocissimum]